MTTVGRDWQSHARRLANELIAAGHLSDPAWVAVFERTPRHVFVPAFYAPGERRAAGTLICAQDAEDVGGWLDTVYRNEALLTQHRAVNSDIKGVPTSSSTWPSAMAVMLERLQVRDGDSVLEIGTGTGYNAALLCHRLGDSHVTSIEIDSELTRQARDRLAGLGHYPTLISGDGNAGAPDRAPFDAIIATCAVSHIPPAWIAQLTPGGRLVAPFGSVSGALAVLTKTDDVVIGTFDEFTVYFMPLRERIDDPSGPLEVYGLPPVDPPAPYEAVTDLNPHDLLEPEFQFWLELHLAPVNLAVTEPTEHQPATLLARTSDSYATITTQARVDGTYLVRQFGRRRPYDTIETAWRSWQYHDRPGRTRLGIWASTDINQQYLWLDSHTGDLFWPMPTPTQRADRNRPR